MVPGWQTNVSRAWIGRALFSDKKGTLTANLKLWWDHPPVPAIIHHAHTGQLLPQKVAAVDAQKDVESRLQVFQLSRPDSVIKGTVQERPSHDESQGFLSEYLDCRECNRSFISWDER